MPSDMGRPPVDFSRSIAKAENSVRNAIISLTRRRKRFVLSLVLITSIFFYFRSGSRPADSRSDYVGTDANAPLDTTSDSTYETQGATGIDVYTYFPISPLSALHDPRYLSASTAPSISPDDLTALTRALLQTLPVLGITPWLSSTTLLGWHWQHNLLPWATTSAPSVHLSSQDLTHLATHYNGSTFSYPSPTKDQNITYIFDISPFYADNNVPVARSGNGIDARYIDTETGLFVALTAVSLSASAVSDEKNAQRGKGAKMKKFLRTRDGHAYESKLVYPLQKSHFEGVECWVPGAAAVLLAQEFGKGALTTRVSNG